MDAVDRFGRLGVIHGPDTAGRIPGELFEDHSVVVPMALSL
jgi:hypothetical protein